MEAKNIFLMRLLLQSILVVFLFSILATCDVDKDKEKCANDLVGLATCLPYVSGEAKTPPIDCCTGLKQVLQKSPVCMCLLVKDRNDPSLGLKINSTLALGLPSQCHSPANATNCPALLHLAPNSPDAKVFEDFANIGKGNSNTTTAPADGGSSARTTATTTKTDQNTGGNKKRILGIEMILGLAITMVVVQNFPNL